MVVLTGMVQLAAARRGLTQPLIPAMVAAAVAVGPVPPTQQTVVLLVALAVVTVVEEEEQVITVKAAEQMSVAPAQPASSSSPTRPLLALRPRPRASYACTAMSYCTLACASTKHVCILNLQSGFYFLPAL